MAAKEREARIGRSRALAGNPGRAGTLDAPGSTAAPEASVLQRSPGLLFARTLEAIRASAGRRAYLTYGDVAAANGLTWQAARMRIDPHLFDICRWATFRAWPLLTAIVVDQPNRRTGRMTGVPLIGFARAAERCGRIVGPDAAAFLAEEQQRVFAWAEKETLPHDLHH